MNRALLLLLLVICLLSCRENPSPSSKSSTIDQRLSIITIGADSLEAMRQFYVDKFGWTPVAENKDIIFFKLNGLLLGLYGRTQLAAFTNSSPEGSGFRPYTFAYMVDSDEKVKLLYDEFKAKGVIIIQEPTVPPIGGYYFLLADIEGNVWEIARNPFMPLDKEGNVITHESISNIQ